MEEDEFVEVEIICKAVALSKFEGDPNFPGTPFLQLKEGDMIDVIQVKNWNKDPLTNFSF